MLKRAQIFQRAGVRSLCTISLLCCLVVTLHAQITTASLNGTVQDPSGGVIPDAELIIVNDESGARREAKSNETGYYSVLLLPPGNYSITITKQGFATQARRGIELLVNQSAKLDITLQLGQVGQVIEVSTAPPPLETEFSNMGTVVEQRKVAELPLNGRMYSQLLVLLPGVTPTNTNRPTPSLGAGGLVPSINGQKNRSNLFYVDGMYATDPFFSSFSISPSIDVIQEFKLQTHVDAAEFGNAAGGIVNVVTKSGSNQFHGSLYEFIRNDKFDARGFFTVQKGAYRQNQFGATFGGPIRRDKTFFFVNYEGFRSSKQSSILSRVLTPGEAAGVFTGQAPIYDPYSTVADPTRPGAFVRTPYNNNVIPASQLNPGIQDWIRLYVPAPNYSGAGLNYINTQAQTTNQNQYNGRFDHQINEKNSVFGRFSYSNTDNFAPQTLPATPYVTGFPVYNGIGNLIHTFSPSMVGQISGGYQRNTVEQVYLQPDAAAGLLTSRGFDQGFPPNSGGTPFVQFPSLTATGFFGSSSTWGPEGPFGLYQISGSLTKSVGKHSLRAGGSWYRVHGFVTAVFPSETFTSTATANPQRQAGTGLALASMVLGLPSSAARYLGDASLTLTLKTYGAWFQDTFKVTRNLTLNYGLRWDYAGPVNDIGNRFSSFDIYRNQWVIAKGNVDKPAVLPNNVVQLDRNTIIPSMGNNIGPRLGIAYQVTPKTVIRAGGAIMYDTWGSYLQFAQNPRGNWPTGAGQSPSGLNVNLINATAQNPFGNLGTTVPATPFPSGAYASDARYRSGQSFQWNLDVQQQLGSDLTLSTAYVASHGNHTPLRTSYNTAVTPGPGSIASRAPISLMNVFTIDQSINRDNYNSLQAKLTQRFAHGMSLIAAYTYSKSIDIGCSGFGENCDIQQPYNLNTARSVSAFDVTQVFTVSHLAELPFGKGKPFVTSGWASHLLGNWQVNTIASLRSGLPYSVTLGFDNPNIGGGSAHPNLAGDPVLADPTPNRWIDKSAFQTPAQYTFGNLGRNVLRGPGSVNFDFSVMRNFPIRERLAVQFRSEFFNIFNHANFGNPNGTLSSSSFGVVSTSAAPRDIQFGLKVIF